MLIIAAVISLLPAAAGADTYHIFDLGTAGFRTIYGIDTAGDVVIFDRASECDIHENPCYFHFHLGTVISFGTVPPALNYDNGTPCTPALPPGTVISHGVCNGALDAYGEVSPQLGLFANGNFVTGGPVTFLVMNGSGDIAWSDGSDNSEAYDLTAHVPEPNTLMLLATGVLSALGMSRRRFTQIAT
jgi:hypothetical protein